MRTVACEGRCFVLSANQCITRKNLPDWIKTPNTNRANPRNLPDNATTDAPATQPRRSSIVTRTEDNHEITWPSPDAKSPPPASATSHVANGFFPSPLNTTVTPAPSKPQPTTKSATSVQDSSDDEFVSPGGSCIISPTGAILAGPLWQVEDGGILAVTVDFEDCERGRLDLDVAGSYGRGDAFRLEVVGLDISPPPT